MPGTFAYDAGTNTVTVTGGTSGSPADYASFVTADRAGTLNSQDARNITGVDGSPVAVTRAIRPTERLVLGGPAHTLYLVITNWNATSATIRMVGTDYDGNAQQEDIAISGNGTLYTVNRYKTITSTQVTALTGTGLTYTLTQAGWGVIWNKGNNQYQIAATLQVGDGSTSTYFSTRTEQLTWDMRGSASWTTFYAFKVRASATLIGGALLDAASKTGHLGSQFLILGNNGTLTWVIERTDATAIISFYGCHFQADNLWWLHVQVANGNFYSSTMGKRGAVWSWSADVANLVALNAADILSLVTGTSTVSNVTGYISSVLTNFGGNPLPVSNATITTTYAQSINFLADNYDGYLINCVLNKWIIGWGTTNTHKLYRQYTLDIHITDINNNNISGATVALRDKDNNTVFSLSTGADGKIVQQTVSRGYYNKANGDTLQDYGPHTMTITADGYQDYQDVITIDRKMDLEVALLGEVAGGGGVSPVNPGLVPLGIKQVAV